jgi:hypothetical protein
MGICQKSKIQTGEKKFQNGMRREKNIESTRERYKEIKFTHFDFGREKDRRSDVAAKPGFDAMLKISNSTARFSGEV